MHIAYPQNPSPWSAGNHTQLPGTWFVDRFGPARMIVYFNCPVCGNLGTLIDHAILDDGTVEPSVECPTEGCHFHEHIRLEGWMPDA